MSGINKYLGRRLCSVRNTSHSLSENDLQVNLSYNKEQSTEATTRPLLRHPVVSIVLCVW
jgi:hypothetical protein